MMKNARQSYTQQYEHCPLRQSSILSICWQKRSQKDDREALKGAMFLCSSDSFMGMIEKDKLTCKILLYMTVAIKLQRQLLSSV